MDGRVQDAVKDYVRENYGVDYVDMVTEPGPNKILASPVGHPLGHTGLADSVNQSIIENIKKRVEISVHHHGSKIVAIVGHFGCAGNPAEKGDQIEQLKKSKEKVSLFGFPAEIILLWVEGDWKTVERV